MHPSIGKALNGLPRAILLRSGSVFYTGREAFAESSPIYILGLNPGGDPVRKAAATVGADIEEFRKRSVPWSAYADQSWEGAPRGTWGMQPPVLHMLRTLDLDPRRVPASNVVFVRSKNESALRREKDDLLAACWPVHAAVLDALRVGTIVCFGQTAGTWVREQTGATELVDEYRETNQRGWKSRAHRAPDRRVVVTTTHPSRAEWRNPKADPTALVRRALSR